jgi:hypothetical protein
VTVAQSTSRSMSKTVASATGVESNLLGAADQILKRHWFNTDRLHGYLDDIPPAEFEAAFSAAHQADQHIGTQYRNLHQSRDKPSKGPSGTFRRHKSPW